MTALIARAREALEGVTPGPWTNSHYGRYHKKSATVRSPRGVVGAFPWKEMTNAVPNATFIAASRELVPALADALEAALAREAKLREALAKIENEAEFESGDLHDEYAALKMDTLAEIARTALEETAK